MLIIKRASLFFRKPGVDMRYVCLGFLFLFCSAVLVAQPKGEKKQRQKNEFEVIYGGQVVGTAFFTQKVLQFSRDDEEVREVVEEEITYSGTRYRFQYVRQGGVVNGFSVRKYARRNGQFLSGDSYLLTLDTDGVHRAFYKDDGETIVREWTVTEPEMTDNARELMQYIERFWGQYYRPLFAGTFFKRKQKEMPSLGFELLNSERV